MPGQRPQCRAQRSPGCPQLLTLGLVLRQPGFLGAVRLGDLAESGQLGEHRLGLVAVDLGQNRRPGAGREVESLSIDSAHRHLVHQFQRSREDARGEDRGNRPRCRPHVGEDQQSGLHHLRSGQELQGDLGGDTQRALAPHEEPHQVISSHALDGPPAHPNHLAVGEHPLQTQHVVPRHSVLEGPRAPRILRHVAAQRAHLQRVRVWRVEQPLGLDRLHQIAGDDSRLHHRGQVVHRDGFDGLHPLEAEGNSALQGHRAAAFPRSSSARRHRNLVGTRGPQHL